MKIAASLLQIVGLGACSAAGFVVSVEAGLLVSGVAAVLVGVALERR